MPVATPVGDIANAAIGTALFYCACALLDGYTDFPTPLFSGSCDTQVVHDLGGSPSVFDAHEDLPCHLPDGRLVCS